MNEPITKAVAEVTRVAIQAMVEAWVERMHDISGPKIGGTTMKQLTFDWNAEVMYSELKTFRLEVNNVLSIYSTPQAGNLALVKNWLWRKGLQYLETLMTAEKETCNNLEGLFETVTNKLKPQYNETIKSLQFRKLYRYDDENVEEWMGRLHIAAVECNYQEVNRQLKEQFIYGLNVKCMLEEIIKELTATKNDDCITSRGVLAWTKRAEAQRAQTTLLNMLTEIRQFDKIKIPKKVKYDKTRMPVHWNTLGTLCRYCGRIHHPRQCPAYGKMCMECSKIGHFWKVCHSRRSRVVTEMEQEVSQEYTEDDIEMVSIISVCMNKN